MNEAKSGAGRAGKWIGSVAALIVAAVVISNVTGFTGAFAGKKPAAPDAKGAKMKFEVVKTDAEWKKILSPDTYRITRQQGTEQAFTGAYWDNHAKGTYYCADCGRKLFASDTKFESGTGWPSFYQPIEKGAVLTDRDTSYGMVRDEVVCGRCGAHLGHVFDDGPAPTGLRYCMNSGALTFVKEGGPAPPLVPATPAPAEHAAGK